MHKTAAPQDWSIQEEPIYRVKVTSTGKLKGKDLTQFKKRAADEFIAFIKKNPPKPDEIPVHLIALGDLEHYGPNRKGDAFRAEECAKYVHTFEHYAKFYRYHDISDPKKNYGVVKKAVYNGPQGRIELLVYLNGSDDAARRNKGLVADKEIELLEKGEDIPVSMSCVLDPSIPVLTDRGYFPIGGIRPGTTVLTNKGTWRRVTKTIVRKYTGPVVRLFFDCLPMPIDFTADHMLECFSSEESGNVVTKKLTWMHVSHFNIGTTVRMLMPSFYVGFPVAVLHDEEISIAKNGMDPRYLNFSASIREELVEKWIADGAVERKKGGRGIFCRDLLAALHGRDLMYSVGYRPIIKRALVNGKNVFILIFDERVENPDSFFLPSAKVIWYEIREVVDTKVYNLEVEGDHSYSLMGLSSHNCFPEYDVCSGCGNIAKSMLLWCDESKCHPYGGLKNHAGHVFDDGFVLYADNFRPIWVDISHVIRPADRIAYILGKLADKGIISHDEEEKDDRKEDQEKKETKKKKSAQDFYRKAASSDNVFDHINVIIDHIYPNLKQIYDYVPDSFVIPKSADSNELFSALVREKILLPPSAFLAVFGGASPDVARKVAAYMDLNQTIEELRKGNIPDEPRFQFIAAGNPNVISWARSLKEDYGLDVKDTKRFWKYSLYKSGSISDNIPADFYPLRKLREIYRDYVFETLYFMSREI